MRRWLARLAFSFMVLAAALAWEGHRARRGDRGPGQAWKAYACFAGAALCFGLGLRGVRERHRASAEPHRDAGEDDRGTGGRA